MPVFFVISFSVLLLIAGMASGCGRPGAVRPTLVEDGLVPAMALSLEAPAAAVCADGEGLLVLAASGARVIVFDAGLNPVDTVSLTDRVVGPQGVAADRFYIYVYNDQTLYRLQKKDPVLTSWLHGARTAGLAVYSPGEILISDADRATVWFKTLFGDSRMFLDVTELARPGALAALPDGMFAALSGGTVIVRFNRAGIVTDRQALSEPVDMMVADRAGLLYLARRGSPELVVVQPDGRSFRYALLGESEPTGLAVLTEGVVILDRDSRLLLYRLP